MNDALKKLESLLQNAAAGPQPFPPTSRYNTAALLTHVDAGGRVLAYLARRVIPAPDRFSSVQTHTVEAKDRLDNLSAQYNGDPELWWRIADANGAVRPAELTETPGRPLRITLAEGVPSGTDD